MRHFVVLLLAFVALAAAWTKEDHEIFRLKDEIEQSDGPNTTFYSFLTITPSATQDEIGKALRRLAKLHHPDKAKAAFVASRATAASASARSSYRSATSSAKAAGKAAGDVKPPKPTTHATKPPTDREIRAAIKRATERSARIGTIGELLKGPARERYDHFLRNGFPAWRGTGWYYQRYRPGLGSVLAGLFVFAGGAVHYAVLSMSYRRRRAFVARYVEHARALAWGDSSGLAGIPGLGADAPAAATPAAAAEPADEESPAVQAMNRRERRAQDKASKKPSAKARKAQKDSGTSTPQSEPAAAAASDPAVAAGSPAPAPGPRKRVLAENGKVLVVDSAGAVFLEQTVKDDEDDSEDEGTPQLFLLDPDEEHRPSIKDTMVWRLPAWTARRVRLSFEALTGGHGGEAETEADQAKPRRRVLKPKPGQFGAPAPEPKARPEPEAAVDGEVDGFVEVAGDDAAAQQWAQQAAGGGAARKRKTKTKK